MKTRAVFVLLNTLVAAAAFAQAPTAKPVEGTLTLDKKTYQLRHALAYETTIDNEEAVAVVLSGQAVASEKLKEAREAEKDGGDPDFTRPFVRLVFKKTGEIKHWSAAAGGTSIGRRSGTATGEIRRQESRVVGKASVSGDLQGMFPTSFDVRFDAPLVRSGETLPASAATKGGPAANVQPTVTGVFRGNGQEAKIAYVSARWSEPFNDKPGITLVLTEKDHSKERKSDTGAMFGKFGSALIISLHDDGAIYGCQVVHSAHQKQGFSSIGAVEAVDFEYANGKVEGELTTHGEKDTFGEKWDVKLKFVAPLGEVPKEFQVAKRVEPAKEKSPAGSDTDEDEEEAEPAGDEPKAKDLPLTKDATDVDYKGLVEQIAFRSKSDVKSVCAELAGNLKAQGWKEDGKDMIQPKSSILKRKRGDASLTIFVKPAEGGSEIKMLTEGLQWE